MNSSKLQEIGNTRIVILDGFRVLAVLAVLLFHFFSRFVYPRYKEDLYPYGNEYDFFGLGYLGVHFFFIISGFVIFFTLEKTLNFKSFWKKRLIRLFPSMLLASIIIYSFFSIFNHQNSSEFQKGLNFIPSLTFINPNLLNNIFETFFGIQLNLNYLNGSFWSLWVEIQFYLFASLIFYWNKFTFLRNAILISIGLCVVNLVVNSMGGANIFGLPFAQEITLIYTKWIDFGFNLIGYLPFFVIGMIFYQLFKNKNEGIKPALFLKLSLLFLCCFVLGFGRSNEERIIILLMVLLFLIFIYYPEKLKFFENSFFRVNGEASYFLYLIHENVGVFIITVLGSYFIPYGFILPVLLIVLFAYLSVLHFRYIDVKINKYLKLKFLNKS